MTFPAAFSGTPAEIAEHEERVKGFVDGTAIIQVTFGKGVVWSKDLEEGWHVERRSVQRSPRAAR